mmetsp:Transcript_2365/g.4904  ORF Transcript_2365/g.4904 Transcript_2365/m.4904 type:complete len:82 (-) Transcript_2365:299-544(-)
MVKTGEKKTAKNQSRKKVDTHATTMQVFSRSAGGGRVEERGRGGGEEGERRRRGRRQSKSEPLEVVQKVTVSSSCTHNQPA